MFFSQPNSHSHYLCLKLKPLYKELLYTITHKMGNPSSTEVFTDRQLQQYIKEVKKTNNSASHVTQLRYGVGVMTDYRACVFSFALSVLSTRLSLWQSRSTTAWWRKYRAQRWERKSACLFQWMCLLRPLTSIRCMYTKDLTFHHLLFGLPFVSGRNGVIGNLVFPWFMEDLGSCYWRWVCCSEP